MRGALIGSGLAHLIVVTALLIVRHGAPLRVATSDVVQVSLADPSALAAVTPPPAPQPVVQKQEPEIAPEEAEGVKLEKPKPPPKKKPEPQQQTPPPSLARTALPLAQIGNAGLSGEMAVDQGDFAFTYYLVLVRNKVAQNWNAPGGISSGGKVRCVVYFHIGREGRVSGVQLEQGSGVDYFDRSAQRAVTLADPLPPLPIGFPGSDLGVHFGFEYQQP
ncbi:MAG TPA: energy transducer TonB [Candidatus Eisenbacteria bacterium]|nr:energy transducer TonB [Candidatus Eisenbacteria bacterium]